MRKIVGYLTKNRSGKNQKIVQSTHENEYIKPRKTFWRNSKQLLKQRAGQLTEKWDNKQSAFHEHFLLFGQGIGKHCHFVLIARFVHFSNQFLECCHVFGKWGYYLGNVLTATHYDKFKLA